MVTCVLRRITIDSTRLSVAVTPFARVGQYWWSHGKGRAGTPFHPSDPGRLEGGHSFAG
jgi:hypothetical protein